MGDVNGKRSAAGQAPMRLEELAPPGGRESAGFDRELLDRALLHPLPGDGSHQRTLGRAPHGTKMRAVASQKNIAGAERLHRDLTHTEKEIAYYLDRLDAIDEAVTQGFDNQPAHWQAFTDAIGSLTRRKERLARRQEVLAEREEKVLVFGEPDATPMGYGHSPKMPCYNMQSVVDVRPKQNSCKRDVPLLLCCLRGCLETIGRMAGCCNVACSPPIVN
ncbi:MAG: transposase family protein [Rhodospirillales bacterium]|jgi:hypothetical protein|nr:transposase family protein [Rhodospirillales bacterium]